MTGVSKPGAEQNLFKIVLAPAIALICLGATVVLQLPKLHSLTHTVNSPTEYFKEEEFERTQITLFKQLPSFSFNNLIADWAFLKFLQYFGDGLTRQKTGYSLAPEYFEVIVNRDPRFIKPYLFISAASSIYAGRPDRTVALMEEGLKSISPNNSPDSYLIWIYKAADELLFLGDTKAAQRSYEMAARWASIQNGPQSQQIAARARETAQFLASNPDSKRAQANSWAMVLVNAVDDRTRQLAIDRIEALGGKVTITTQGEVKIAPPKND
jgi:hypothetical protein